MAVEPTEARPTGRRVLVIDDEPALRTTLEMLLRRQYDVTSCGGGHEALQRVADDPPYDVILCDLVMQEMSGVDLYLALRAAHPELLPRIVFLTGGVFAPEMQAFLDSIPNPVLEKPFDVDVLRAAIARIVS